MEVSVPYFVWQRKVVANYLQNSQSHWLNLG